MAQLMPLPLTVSCFSKIQICFTFLVPAHPGSPGKRAVKRVCVCVCVSAAVAVDSSYVTASSSALWSRFSPPSIFVNGHVLTIWFIVGRWPQSQEGDWVRPHFCKLAQHGHWPVRKQLNISWQLFTLYYFIYFHWSRWPNSASLQKNGIRWITGKMTMQ